MFCAVSAVLVQRSKPEGTQLSIIRALATLFIATSTLCGCLSILPVDGPASHDIVTRATATLANPPDTAVYNYTIVDLSSIVLDCLDKTEGTSFARTFGRQATRNRKAPAIRVGVGDVLQVSVFESSKEGLFSPPEGTIRAGGFVSLPNQAVSSSGTVSVPYAGEVYVNGRTVPEIERQIEKKLAARAVEPQVVITMVEQNTGTVTVIGDALISANKFKLAGSGERVMDMISKAGGLRFPAYDSFVKIQRKGRVATVYFPRVLDNPEENIFVEPGDLIFVYREQRKYVAAGAIGATGGGATIAGNNTLVGAVGQFSFDQEHLSLNEAIAKAGGLVDSRADPAQVFLYRIEFRETLEAMGVDLRGFPPSQKIIPTIYRANFRDPSSFFYTQRFQVRHKDTIYVGNSDSTEHEKVFTYLSSLTGTMAGVATNLNAVAHGGP
jgi:polysaccharide biosynthesis/export protein